MPVPTYAAAADHGIARIPLEEALSGRLLDDLAAIFGGTAARDRYIARPPGPTAGLGMQSVQGPSARSKKPGYVSPVDCRMPHWRIP